MISVLCSSRCSEPEIVATAIPVPRILGARLIMYLDFPCLISEVRCIGTAELQVQVYVLYPVGLQHHRTC